MPPTVWIVVALTRGHGLSIGLTSYNGGMYFGLNADRDGIPDVEELADCLKASLFELKEASKGRRRPRRAPRQDVLKPDPLAD